MEFTLFFDKDGDVLTWNDDANDIDWIYTTSEEGLSEIKDKLTEDGITTANLEKTNTFYRFSYTLWEWRVVKTCDVPAKILNEVESQLDKQYQEIKEGKEITPVDTNIAWDLVVTLKDGKRFQTNEGYCTLEELMEAINCLKKPSILGRQIVGYELIKHI